MITELTAVPAPGEDSSISLVEITLDAVLELEALAQGDSEEAPSLLSLVRILKDGRRFDSVGSVSMLSDVRGIAVVRRALTSQQAASETDQAALRAIITGYLDYLLAEVNERRIEGIREAKRFCLALNRELLKRQHERLTSRRWRQENAA